MIDQPHRIEIFALYAALLVSAASTLFTYQALTLNRAALEVGERAYLAIQSYELDSHQNPNGTTSAVFSLTFINHGNTPAMATNFSMEPRCFAQGCPVLTWPTPFMFEIAQHQAHSVTMTYDFAKLPDTQGILFASAVGFKGRLDYLDMFKKSHTMNFCLIYLRNKIGHYALEECESIK